MAEEKGLGKFFVYCALILVLFLVMIAVIFSFSGKAIRLELVGLVLLILLTLIGFLGYHGGWGERVLFFVFLFSLINILLIWIFKGRLFVLLLFLSLVGFLMGLPKREEEEFEELEKEEKKVEPYSEIIEEEKKENKVEFVPGRYVASKMGNVYHEPKCVWAKRIVEERRLWFQDKKEARSKGYKQHKCVK